MIEYSKVIYKGLFFAPVIVALQFSIPQVFADPTSLLKKKRNHVSEVEMVPWVRISAVTPSSSSSSQVEVSTSGSSAQFHSTSADPSSSNPPLQSKAPECDQVTSKGPASDETWVNIVPEGSYFMAVESEELAREYKYLFMSDDELRATRDYALFKDDHNQFLVGIDNTVQFRAEVFCKQKGYSSVAGFELEYLQADQFKENQMFRAGWYFEFDPITQLPRVNWEFSRTGKSFEKRMKQKGFRQCPHLVFKKIKCAGVFTPPEMQE